MRVVRCRSTLWMCGLLAALPRDAAGQDVRGRVVSPDATHGVAGVVVVLRDSLEREMARSLTSPDGAFVLRAGATGSSPGNYRITTLRIGYRPGDFGPYRLGAGADTTIELRLDDIRASLPAVRVTENASCRSRDDGGELLLAVWEEARKALIATVLARTERPPTVVTNRYERVLDPVKHRVMRQTIQHRAGSSARPFFSPLSADEYARRGYTESDSTGVTYRGPDADVLLSETFAAGHCFQLATSADSSRIGLAFRPVDRRRGVVDVAGTLWLDRASSELRALDFQYVGLDAEMDDTGGHLDFVTLPDGMWLIDQWRITVPRVVVSRGFALSASGSLADNGTVGTRPVTRRSVPEIWEFGGAVASVRLEQGGEWRGPTARLAGVVTDVESDVPVPGATVFLRGTDYGTRTDSLGRFTLVDVLPARYQVDARSPARTALGLDDTVDAEVDLRDTASLAIMLRTPALRGALARVCGDDERNAMDTRHGVLQGRVRWTDGRPVAGAAVVADWLESVDLQGRDVVGVSARELNAQTVSGTDGSFRLCGIPADRTIHVMARRDTLRSARAVTRLSMGAPVTLIDLQVARAAATSPPE
jgi:hypothetical protein